jgi:MSHA biogenesis protein MshK
MNRAALMLILLAAAPGLLAQLADPTRPPAAGAGMAQAGQDDAPAGRQLQSVLLSGGRKVAVIDGKMVPLGGMIGDARVVRIGETEVVLKTGQETETLKLFPGVEKRPAGRVAGSVRASDVPREPRKGGGSK